ncbi:MAG: LPS-assembly protein LptD [Betaproteobacteria bacterium]
MPRSFDSLAPIVVALALAWPAAAAAQETTPPGATPPPDTATTPAAPPAPAGHGKHAAAASPAEGPPVDAGEIHVKAESFERPEKGHLEARGTVDLRLADTRILADKADVYEEPQPDGTTRRHLVAVGNVVLIRGAERLAGDRAEVDDTGHGFFYNAVGYVEPGLFFEAQRVERVDARTYKVEGGRFTACSQPNPRWKFSASRATVEVDDKVIATNTVFRIKGVPAFYLPWLLYPIRRDGRSTGFLFPHFGYSSYRGFTTGTGFFWAMGRSADQTFSLDYFSKLGYGLGHDLRWAGDSPSRGTLRTYMFRLTPTDPVLDPATGEVIDPGRAQKTDYDIDWNALQMLPSKVRVAVNVRKFSDLLFQQRFQDNFNLATSRTERWSGSVERDFPFAVVSAYADSTDTYFGSDYTNVSERLPGFSLRRFPRQIGRSKIVFGLQAEADNFRYGNQDRVDSWSRYDFAPSLSRPFTLSFLDVNPSFSYRYTRYGKSLATDENGEAVIAGPPVDRSFFETGIDLRGPTFSRVFDTPGFFYSDRFKHTIGPEISWHYRSRVKDASEIPKFDGQDYLYGDDQLQYALVQRFYKKRRSLTGKPMPYEFLTWRIMQTYYVQIKEGQSNFDPNYSSSAFGPGFRPEHLSPLSSRLKLRPSPEYSFDYNVEYDVNFNQLKRMSLLANVNTARFSLSGGWSRALRTSEIPAERTVGSHTLRGSTAMELWPKRLHLEGSADYDLLRDTLLQLRGQLRYSVQCCGLSVEHIRYNWNQVVDSRWRFNIELAGIGSMGNFMGADLPGSRQGLGGYR